MTFAIKKKKCYELDSFDFGRLLELVFTFCLGKINRVVGAEKYMWSFGLLISLCVSMLLLIRVTKALPVGIGLCYMDRYRCRRYGADRYLFL